MILYNQFLFNSLGQHFNIWQMADKDGQLKILPTTLKAAGLDEAS
jgi:hypothetical protein